jgi:hypothetical protein
LSGALVGNQSTKEAEVSMFDEFMAIPNLSRESQRKILWDNCARLYGLD